MSRTWPANQATALQVQISGIRDTDVDSGSDGTDAVIDRSIGRVCRAGRDPGEEPLRLSGLTKRMSRQLSQQEIDAVFQSTQGRHTEKAGAKRAALFDFRRPDRIAKSQLRAIHQLHDNFVRNLVSSLSAYLRSYLIVNLVSVEQLCLFGVSRDTMPSPTCIASLSLKPYDGNAVLELNSSLIFPILEILLGGDGKLQFSAQREITEIEQVLLDGLFRLILRDLREAWKFVTQIDFAIDTVETEPQFLQILAPTEAVVAVAIEIRIGDSIGMMNIAMPSIIIKMMRQKFDQQWSLRKSASTESRSRRAC